MNFKPNHICKNSNCPYGIDGKPKEYFACDACDRNSYRALACSPECYAEVIKRIQPDEAVKPNRTDKTPEEVNRIMTAPIEEVEKSSIESLGEFKDEALKNGFESAVDKINDLIDAEAKPKKKRKKKSGGSD